MKRNLLGAACLGMLILVGSTRSIAKAEAPTTKPADERPIAEFATPDDAAAFVEEWSKSLTTETAGEAFALLAQATPTYDAKSSRALGETTQTWMKSYAATYGSFIGIERLEVRPKGNSLALLSYVVKFEKMPVVLHVLAYRGSGDAWRIVGWTFDKHGPYGPFGVVDTATEAAK